MVSQELLDELRIIIQEDYGLCLQSQVLTEVANTLISFFDSLTRIECHHQFGGKYGDKTKSTQ